MSHKMSLEQALEEARIAKGNTVLVLVSPKQAERLHLAMLLADQLVGEIAAPEDLFKQWVVRYKALATPVVPDAET